MEYEHGIYFDELPIVKAPPPLNKFKQTIHAVHGLVQSPIEMVFASALSTAAICTQGLVNVRCPGSGESPVSLNILVNADSGERKTSTDKYFTSRISDFERDAIKQFDHNETSYNVDTEIWKSRLKNIKKSIDKSVDEGSEDNAEMFLLIREKLRNHIESKPQKQANIRILYEDITISALLENLATGWKNVSLNSSEGGIILTRTNTSYLPYLNKLWGGEEVRVDRSTRPSYIIREARLSITVMAQKKMLERFLKRGDGMGRASGFLARCLVIEPHSTQGYRFNTLSPEQKAQNNTYIDWFNNRASQLLQENLEKKDEPRQIISFSPEAANIWSDFYNSVESALTEDGILSDIRDFASKISNNMSRVAAALHCFCGEQGDITAETARFSVEICKNFLMEFKKIVRFLDAENLIYENACKLHCFLKAKHEQIGSTLSKTYILQFGPNSCRLLDALEPAILLLERQKILYRSFSINNFNQEMIGLSLEGYLLEKPIPIIKKFDTSWHQLLQPSTIY